MNKKVYLCDIEALKEGTNDKYGVSATLVFNEGLTYKELEQVIDEKYFYLSNNNLQEEIEDLKADYGSKAQVERDILQERIDKAMEHLKIKQARLINEKNYVITDLDLDEIMQDLESKGDSNEK